MVKKGPCFHCGINSTPLWRNGPAEKPVLCNACGSRYKLKGHLENYLPKNVQQQLYLNNINKNIDGRSEDKLSNHVPDGTGGVNPNLWNKIPSRKRSPVVHKRMTPIERFGKQLLSLFRCQRQPEEVSLVHNMNNFIPKNEIGLGVTLLKTDVASMDPESICTCSESSTSAT